MSSIILLFAIGLILLGFEVFVPGAILGLFGGIALLGASVVAFLHYGPSGGLLTFGLALVAGGILLYVELRVLPRTTLGRKLFLKAAVTGKTSLPPLPQEVVGQLGQTVTTLAPSGYVLLAGKRHEAYSQSGYMPAGATVRVVGADNFRLIVTQA